MWVWFSITQTPLVAGYHNNISWLPIMPRSKQHRAWVFTLNNYTQSDLDELKHLAPMRYIVYGRECGSEKQTKHLQGYIYMDKKYTMAAIRKIAQWSKRAHFEPRLGSHSEARNYCIKEGDFIELGVPPKENSKGRSSALDGNTLMSTSLNDLLSKELISPFSVPTLYKAKAILLNEGEPRTRATTCGYWIYGPPGVGKSHIAHNLFPNAFIKQQNKWFDGYEGQETILLDDLDTSVLGHHLKIWTDKWPCRGEIKGGTVPLRHKRFIITSNYLPSQIWSEDLMLATAIERRMTFWKINKRRN